MRKNAAVMHTQSGTRDWYQVQLISAELRPVYEQIAWSGAVRSNPVLQSAYCHHSPNFPQTPVHLNQNPGYVHNPISIRNTFFVFLTGLCPKLKLTPEHFYLNMQTQHAHVEESYLTWCNPIKVIRRSYYISIGRFIPSCILADSLTIDHVSH